MRRILVENARRKLRVKRGGDLERVELESVDLYASSPPEELIAIHEALDTMAKDDPQAADFVKLRYFAGLSVKEAAEMIEISRSTAYEHWAYARAWLKREIQGSDNSPLD